MKYMPKHDELLYRHATNPDAAKMLARKQQKLALANPDEIPTE